MPMIELTPPQAKLLVSIDMRPQSVADHYPPFVRLLNLGLVRVSEVGLSSTVHITRAGQDLIASWPAEKREAVAASIEAR